MDKEYTNLTALAARAASASEKEELRILVEDIQKEMNRAMQMLREEDSKAIREIITEERYQLKNMQHDVRNTLSRIVLREMRERRNAA